MLVHPLAAVLLSPMSTARSSLALQSAFRGKLARREVFHHMVLPRMLEAGLRRRQELEDSRCACLLWGNWGPAQRILGSLVQQAFLAGRNAQQGRDQQGAQLLAPLSPLSAAGMSVASPARLSRCRLCAAAACCAASSCGSAVQPL